jgi:hypothetical protein
MAKKVAGLRVPEPKPRKPHVVVVKTFKCSECAFYSPISETIVEQHIERQHTKQNLPDQVK